MQIFFFDPIQTLLIDVIAWVIFHLTIGYLCSRIPVDRLNPNQWLFQTFPWEKGGKIYDQIFHVRAWKHLIPNGSALYKGTFSIKHLASSNLEYLERWLKESVRAELCHWIMIVPGFLFFLWNSIGVGWAMVAYAILNNLIPIVMQRYNRPRIRRLIEKARRAFPQVPLPSTPVQPHHLAGAEV